MQDSKFRTVIRRFPPAIVFGIVAWLGAVAMIETLHFRDFEIFLDFVPGTAVFYFGYGCPLLLLAAIFAANLIFWPGCFFF